MASSCYSAGPAGASSSARTPPFCPAREDTLLAPHRPGSLACLCSAGCGVVASTGFSAVIVTRQPNGQADFLYEEVCGKPLAGDPSKAHAVNGAQQLEVKS